MIVNLRLLLTIMYPPPPCRLVTALGLLRGGPSAGGNGCIIIYEWNGGIAAYDYLESGVALSPARFSCE